MAITDFQIVRLPRNVICKIRDSEITNGSTYDISDEADLNFKRFPELEGYYLSKKLKFRTYDSSVQKYSNEAEINLVWEANSSVLPSSENNTHLLQYGNAIKLLDHLPINSATEFIEITEVTEGVIVPYVFLEENREVVPGERFSPEDLFYSFFQISEVRNRYPYFVLKYKVGRNNVLQPEEYTFTLNAELPLQINLLYQTVSGPELGIVEIGNNTMVFNEVSQFEVAGGKPNETVQLTFDFANLLDSVPEDDVKRVIITGNGQTYNATSGSLLYPLTFDLDSSGQLNFTTMFIKDADESSPSESFQIFISEVNGEAQGPLFITLTVLSEL